MTSDPCDEDVPWPIKLALVVAIIAIFYALGTIFSVLLILLT